jgi:hypothetical protein
MSGFDPSNPAFRPPGLPGYAPPGGPHPGLCRDPYCRDPACPAAAYSAYMARLSGAAGLPPGYLELLEAYKMYAPGGSIPGLHAPAPPPPPTTSSAAAAGGPAGPVGPYICNWMNGRDYCGKRFGTAEELLVHLKTHTNLSVSDAHLTSAASLSAAYSSLFAGTYICERILQDSKLETRTLFVSVLFKNLC